MTKRLTINLEDRQLIRLDQAGLRRLMHEIERVTTEAKRRGCTIFSGRNDAEMRTYWIIDKRTA